MEHAPHGQLAGLACGVKIISIRTRMRGSYYSWCLDCSRLRGAMNGRSLTPFPGYSSPGKVRGFEL